MARKGGKKPKAPPRSSSPRRGMRRSIRFDAIEDQAEDRPRRGPEPPPTITLRKVTAEEALHRLATQISSFSRHGKTEILVVHGKGQNSEQGISVLGPLARQWCDDNPALVASWREAPSYWGGAGAIVVVLN